MAGQIIELTAADGHKLSAYRADPAGKPKGGIVVVQEIFGVNAHIRSVAELYAAEGYLAIAPAVFDRVESGVELGYDMAGIEHGRGLAMKGNMGNVLLDVTAAAKVAAEAGKVGVVGYCFGGTVAWLASVKALPGVTAAVGYYGGGIAGALSEAPKLPVILHFGERDAHIPLTDVEKIKAAYPSVPVYIYTADHGFNCDARGSYDKPAADLARKRSLEFLSEHVG